MKALLFVLLLQFVWALTSEVVELGGATMELGVATNEHDESDDTRDTPQQRYDGKDKEPTDGVDKEHNASRLKVKKKLATVSQAKQISQKKKQEKVRKDAPEEEAAEVAAELAVKTQDSSAIAKAAEKAAAAPK
jgi:hypothetical protein